ncbi:caspase family protein [Ramlibacter sp. AN1133]|uniref:caspase family protein n=1 Tax=Ramlibacter sp. AN1133 TaxID=3133429 RepID=UPI0030BD5A53
MPTPTFQRLTLEQFAALLQKFPFHRRINAVHMHHTWRPNRQQFKGHDSIVAMWRFHTQTNGWSDIAQHITIDPQGLIWLGRNWNLPPASASGHNGNSTAGPFMFEMVGDFDAGPGHDTFDGPQRDTAFKVIALVQQQFGLEPGTLRLHNMMGPKTCPGSAIRYQDVLQGVAQAGQALQAAQGAREVEAAGARSPFPDDDDLAIQQAIRALGRVTDLGGERADADHVCAEDHLEAQGREGALVELQGAQPRDSGLDPATLAALRPHLVNLRAGKFSSEGEMSSTPEDVDAIFQQHLPRWLAQHQGGKARVVFFAHGGLVSESSGLRIAHKHVQWWKDNGVYPIYFLWETGFFETIGQILERAVGGRRGLADVSDFMIEELARALQGVRIWGSMKWSAERAADKPSPGAPIGGAWYVAQQLKKFCDGNGKGVDLHAVGHSAGSIFHAWFLPAAQDLGVPAFQSLHLMAPAIRVDTFKAQLLQRLQQGLAAKTTIYTMLRDFELKDNCAEVYRKSLLYLIHHALEDRRRTPILGLEESLRRDADLRAFFGLDAPQAGSNEVIWSVTDSDSGRSASRSHKHGDFDDDAPTMNSIVRRVLDKADADPITEYRPPVQGQRGWVEEVDWPAGFQAPAAPASRWGWKWTPPWATSPAPAPVPPYVPPLEPAAPQPPAIAAAPAGDGRRIALCIGVDEYPNPQHRLSGCVNDAQTWAGALTRLGFQTRMLVNGQATRAGIDAALRELIGQSRAGDVIVLQYAGHGTNVADLDGDETDGRDEALCPVDFASGALFIDDDIARVFATLPEGVNLTVFMDCCHSGTNTRFAVGLEPGALAVPPGTKARYVPPSPALDQAHAEFRQQNASLTREVRAGGTGGAEAMRHVKFSACLDTEVALESGGNGEFTRRAARVLGRGIQGLSNEAFLQAVLTEFGSNAQQRPMLDCASGARAAPLLLPLAGGGRAVDACPPGAGSREAALVQAVQALAQSVQALAGR